MTGVCKIKELVNRNNKGKKMWDVVECAKNP